MLGRVSTLNGRTASGSIRAENGEKIHFDSSAGVTHDVTSLGVGQLVTYELAAGQQAVNVRVHTADPLPDQRGKVPDHQRPRYLGFDQTGSVRSYRFERIVPREERRDFIVTADMSLFTKHHVGVQEGPALCLLVLTRELDAVLPLSEPSSCHVLTDSDMLAYVFSRNAATVKKHGKRASAKTAVS